MIIIVSKTFLVAGDLLQTAAQRARLSLRAGRPNRPVRRIGKERGVALLFLYLLALPIIVQWKTRTYRGIMFPSYVIQCHTYSAYLLSYMLVPVGRTEDDRRIHPSHQSASRGTSGLPLILHLGAMGRSHLIYWVACGRRAEYGDSTPLRCSPSSRGGTRVP